MKFITHIRALVESRLILTFSVSKDEHITTSASNSKIAAYTAELIRINAPVLGHSHDRLIRPGDVLQLGVAGPDVVVPAPEAP